MQDWRRILVCVGVLGAAWAVTPAIAAETFSGIWADGDSKYYYALLKNNEFRFSGLTQVRSQPPYEWVRKEVDGV